MFGANYLKGTVLAQPGGNWEGNSIPNRLDRMDLSADMQARWQQLRPGLIAERGKRVPPARDDKILADWNGLMITALARAAALFGQPNWLALAKAAFHFVAERD